MGVEANRLTQVWEAGAVQLGAVIAAGAAQNVFSEHGLTDLLQDFRMANMMGCIWLDVADLSAEELLLPLLVQGDLSAAEIAECVNSTTQRAHQVPESDQGERLVFPLTDAQGNPVFLSAARSEISYRMKVNRTWHEDVGWNIACYNFGNQDTTAAPQLGHVAKYQGVWIN